MVRVWYLIDQWFGFGMLRLIRNVEADLVSTLVVVARVAEVNWAALQDQEWFSYDYGQGMLLLTPGEVQLIARMLERMKLRETCSVWPAQLIVLGMQLVG